MRWRRKKGRARKKKVDFYTVVSIIEVHRRLLCYTSCPPTFSDHRAPAPCDRAWAKARACAVLAWGAAAWGAARIVCSWTPAPWCHAYMELSPACLRWSILIRCIPRLSKSWLSMSHPEPEPKPEQQASPPAAADAAGRSSRS